MMAPVPPSIAHRPAAAPADEERTAEKKKGADPLSFLASITERVLGTKKKNSAEPSQSASEEVATPGPDDAAGERKPPAAPNVTAASSGKKETKAKKSGKDKKSATVKKRKRIKQDEDEEEDRKVSPRLEGANRPPVAHVVINNSDNVSLQEDMGTTGEISSNDFRGQFETALAEQISQQATTQAQLQQDLLLKERILAMGNPTLNHLPESFLSRQYAALEQEEMELAALRRRREQLLLNMSSREELLMRNAAAAGNLNNPALFGMTGAGINNNNIDLAAMAAASGHRQLASASAFSDPLRQNFASTQFGQIDLHGGNNMKNALAAASASMNHPSASLMGGMNNSPLLRALSTQNALSSLQNPSLATAASSLPSASLVGSADPTATISASVGAIGLPSNLTESAGTTEEIDAKRLAPARGVFNKNIKSNDDVIDSLARANARFYKNDNKKAGQQRFRGYQCEQWTQKYQDLLEFKAEHGNCQVPHCYKKNIGLARWVKRQRYQYKLMVDGKQSTMTDERVKLLQDIGFVWDSHSSTWLERLNELREYRRIHGDCNVPSSYSENPKLATWIKCQRRQYKLLQEGKTSNMTLERMTELQRVGFCWRVQDERR